MTMKRRLLIERLARFAGYAPNSIHAAQCVPVARAQRLRAQGLSWRTVALELDAVYSGDFSEKSSNTAKSATISTSCM
jgi:hypothetical protein